MSKAQLVNLDTGDTLELPRKCTVGRAEDNDVVISDRWVSRRHCVIVRGLFGGWFLKQFGPQAGGPAAASHTTIRREGRIIHVHSAQKYRLETGDTLAFGKPPGDETIVLTHEFRILE